MGIVGGLKRIGKEGETRSAWMASLIRKDTFVDVVHIIRLRDGDSIAGLYQSRHINRRPRAM